MALSGPLAMAASDAVITLAAFSASFRLGTVFYSRFLCRESEPRQYVVWYRLPVAVHLYSCPAAELSSQPLCVCF